MKKNHIKLWLDFCQYLIDENFEVTDKYHFFNLLCGWLSKNIKNLGEELWSVYKFDSYVQYQPEDYPMDCSDVDVEQTINRMNNLQPSSKDMIAMIIRDILWNLVSYKSNIACSNCGDDDFRILYDEKLEQLVLSCDLCGCAQFEDGKKWEKNHCLVPAKVTELKFSGYL